MAAAQAEILDLYDWEYDLAVYVGTRRNEANLGRKDAHYYKRSLMQDDLKGNIAACIAEIAVARYTNRYWSGSFWARSQHDRHAKTVADVGTNIEVRRVRHPNGKAAVRRKQIGEGLVLWVCRPVEPDLRQVEMFGWIDYDEAWNLGQPAPYDPSGETRVIARSHLHTKLPVLKVVDAPAPDPA